MSKPMCGSIFQRLLVALTLSILTLSGRPALAHPHVWIEARPTLVYRGGKITSIILDWRFDPIFSSLLIRNFDRNKNGAFEIAEQKNVKKGAFRALDKFDFFTFIKIAGKQVKIKKSHAFSARLVDNRVHYRFRLDLPNPVDPRTQNVSIRFLDETYYVDVKLIEKNGVSVRGKNTCGYRIRDDKKNPIYFGMVIPRQLVVQCPGT